MALTATLHLDNVAWSRHQIAIRWGVDDLSFATDIWYADLDLTTVRARVGDSYADYLGLVIALYEINKGLSLAPAELEVCESLQPYLTQETYDIWHAISRRIWGQWRYEHDLPNYTGPVLSSPVGDRHVEPVSLHPDVQERRALWFCGGGKDSLVTSSLLDVSGIPYDSIGFSFSIYGNHEHQHQLLEGMASRTQARIRHRMVQNDTALGLPIAELVDDPAVSYILAGETPSSIFEAVPYIIEHGYELLIFGNERSANHPNLFWTDADEEVNHQWGKSLEAEDMLNGFLQGHLCDAQYVSSLQPVRDPLIFAALRDNLDKLASAHSCNIRKPWCHECAKCLYVWISYCAWLPLDAVADAVGAMDLLDREANRPWVRQLLGLDEHTPFECVGQPDEAYLAFHMARAKGVDGTLMSLLDEAPERPLYGPSLDELLRVDHEQHRMPERLAAPTLEYFEAVASRARELVAGALSGVRT